MAALSQAVTKAEAAAELIANEFAAKAREEKEGQQQRTTTNKRKQPNDNAGDDNMKTKKKQLEKEKLQEILATLVKAKLKKHDDDNIPVPITITQRSSLREVEPTVVSPLVVENPETILRQNVECYVSGLLASFPRETLKSMVHEILIVYPQSKYAIKKERPLLHQRRGGRFGQVGCTYITFEWNHIKELLCALGPIIKTPGCNKFVKHFHACFVNNVSNIGCTKIPTLGRWCGIRIYGPEARKLISMILHGI